MFLDGEVLPRVPPRTLACWLLVFLKYVFVDRLSCERAPDPFGVEGRWQWRGLAACYIRCFPFFCPCKVPVHGAAGHNRWGVAETPLLAKTQGRNMDRSLST